MSLSLNKKNVLGIVTEGKFFSFDRDKPIEVITIPIISSKPRTPLNLVEYEGKVIMIKGDVTEETIYEAKVIDVATPILSAIVLKIYSR